MPYFDVMQQPNGRRWKDSVWRRPYDIMQNEYRIPATAELRIAVEAFWKGSDGSTLDRMFSRLAIADASLQAFLDFVSEYDLNISPFYDAEPNEIVLEIS